MELISHSLTPALELGGIRSLIRVGNPVGPLALSVLYLRQSYARLYLNIFRRKPAITEFD